MVHVHAEDPKSPAVPALMQASIQGKVDTIEYLLSQGADVEQSDSFGFNPLHGCAFNQQADACAMMLAHAGVDSAAANSFHEDGLAPMHRACFGDVQADTLRVFLEAGMDRNQRTRCAKTFFSEKSVLQYPRPLVVRTKLGEVDTQIRCVATWRARPKSTLFSRNLLVVRGKPRGRGTSPWMISWPRTRNFRAIMAAIICHYG